MGDTIAKQTEDFEKAYQAARDIGMSDADARKRAFFELRTKDLPKAPDNPIKEGWLEVQKKFKKWGVNAGWVCAALVSNWVAFHLGERGWDGLLRMPAFNALVICVVVLAVLVSGRKKNGGGPSV